MVLGDIALQFWEDDSGFARGPGRSGVVGEELVHDFGQELMRYEGRIGMVGDDDTAHAFRPAIRMESVVL